MATNNEVKQALLDRINGLVADETSAINYSRSILQLSEAYAWLTSTAQPHGSSAPSS